MKIEFNTSSANLNADIDKTEKSTTVSTDKTTKNSGYIVDISGTVMDDAAYGKDLKKAQEVMQDAGLQDVALQRDYMAVMSNSMSSEDFAKLQEEGYSPDQMDIETSVTILDRIKATLAEAGVDIAGFTDEISDEQLEKITGNVSTAQEIKTKLNEQDLPATDETLSQVKKALDQAAELTPISDGAIKYMLLNNLEPTIENVYKAEYSIKGDTSRQSRGYYTDQTGYYAKKAESFDWKQLSTQIEDIIQKSGLEVTDETIGQAKWMIEQGIPLTEETMTELDQLKQIELPIDSNRLIQSIVTAIADGKSAFKADLSNLEQDTTIQQAVKIKETVDQISDEAVKQVIEQKEELTIDHLKRAQTELEQKSDSGISQTQNDIESYEFISAKRILEETRLRMTVEANIKLLKSDYAIETTGLNELVENLKEAERSIYKSLWKEENEATLNGKIEQVKAVNSIFKELPYLPASTIGRLFLNQDEWTISNVVKEGRYQKSLYEKMGESYEALGTAPRRDLGDSIQKAFRNVDDILENLNLEKTEANQRAVRILGYNSMEINSSSVEEIKTADLAINRLIEKMTPAKTMDLIRNGENPLDQDIYQLVEQVDQKNVNEEADQYSEYLWKMEKNNEISEEERNSYIGIYRLLHQIEKNENNVIGRVIQTDQELTLRNLLSAVRSNKAKGMDVSVSDEFGALEDLITDNTSISQQIETAFHQKQYYQNLSKDTLEQLTPEKLKQTSIDLNLSLEAFQEQIANAQDTQEFDQSAYQDQMQRFQEASMAEDQVIQSLIDANEPVTIDHILAQAEWMNHANQTFQQIMTYSGQKKEEKTIFYDQIRERMDNLYENSDQEEGLKTSYEQLLDTCKEMLSETSMEKTSSIDVRAINLIHKQLTIAGSLSKEDDYQMPVYIGEELSVIHLKVIKGTKEGKVTASMNSKKYGDVSAEFEVDGKQVTGIIVSNDSEGVVKLSEIEPKLKELLETTGKEMKKLNFVQSNEYGKTQSAKEDIQKQDNNTDTKSLYEVAKAFITVISGKNER